MNKELMEVFRLYSTRPHEDLTTYLVGKSKDLLISIVVDMLTMYINDKNSSTVREFITVTLAGYTHVEKKIGYNGFKQDTFSGTTIRCEAKPKNIDTNSASIAKLNGGGSFNDYTFKRLAKDKQEKGLNMLVSGFVDGKLIYILEFPFVCVDLINKLKKQLWKRFPKGKDILTEYLRGASFDYHDFINCDGLRVVYILDKKTLQLFKAYVVNNFYKFLEGKAK